MNTCFPHQYIDRISGDIRTETLLGDRLVQLIYSRIRDAGFLFKALTGSLATDVLACFNYDWPVRHKQKRIQAMIRDLKINMDEVIDPDRIRSVRSLFERKIAYWKTRPMAHEPGTVVSPADSRMVPGSLSKGSALFIKEKFFDVEELLGQGRRRPKIRKTGGSHGNDS